MRTTLDLPEDLLNEAMKAANINTKTGVIVVALEELIRKSKISELKVQRCWQPVSISAGGRLISIWGKKSG